MAIGISYNNLAERQRVKNQTAGATLARITNIPAHELICLRVPPVLETPVFCCSGPLREMAKAKKNFNEKSEKDLTRLMRFDIIENVRRKRNTNPEP